MQRLKRDPLDVAATLVERTAHGAAELKERDPGNNLGRVQRCGARFLTYWQNLEHNFQDQQLPGLLLRGRDLGLCVASGRGDLPAGKDMPYSVIER